MLHGRRQSKNEFNAYLASEAKNGNPMPAILWFIVLLCFLWCDICHPRVLTKSCTVALQTEFLYDLLLVYTINSLVSFLVPLLFSLLEISFDYPALHLFLISQYPLILCLKRYLIH